jgi:hypothetical protein
MDAYSIFSSTSKKYTREELNDLPANEQVCVALHCFVMKGSDFLTNTLEDIAATVGPAFSAALKKLRLLDGHGIPYEVLTAHERMRLTKEWRDKELRVADIILLIKNAQKKDQETYWARMREMWEKQRECSRISGAPTTRYGERT